MSVYYEALTSGRLAASGWSPRLIVTKFGRARASRAGIRQALQAVKRAEAEERNARTPHHKTKRHRREMDAAAARIAARRKEQSNG